MYLRYCLVELVNKSENDKYRDISAVQVAGLPLLRMAPSPNENPYNTPLPVMILVPGNGRHIVHLRAVCLNTIEWEGKNTYERF